LRQQCRRRRHRLSPLGQASYGYVATAGSAAYGVAPLTLDGNSRGEQTNGSSWTSGLFNATAGDQIDVWFNYASTDGKGFDDFAWARLLDATSGDLVAWLFTARSSNSNTGNIVPGDVVTKKEFDPRDSIVNYDSYEFTSKTVRPRLRSLGADGVRRPHRQSRPGVTGAARPRRSPLRADSAVLLGLAARRAIHFVRCAHCVQGPPSQRSRRALLRALAASPALLAASHSRHRPPRAGFAPAQVA
jgi:hypothetical protein